MTIVLVHGAWSGAWSWKSAAQILRARGYEVYAPTLTGLAERSHIPPQNVSLSTHIADIAGLLRYEDLHDVLLVGHSYGGMVITGAADQEPDRIAGMVYVDAFVPENGQSLLDIGSPEHARAQHAAAMAHDGGYSIPRRGGRDTQVDPALAARWAQMFTPQPFATMTEPWRSARAAQTWPRRHYVLCSAYTGSPFQTIAARVRQAPDWEYSEFDALHDVVRADPQLTADRIDDIARAWKIGAAKVAAP